MKYDLIFSIGEACLCTSVLRMLKLQLASYPLDWLYGADFATRCHLLATRFEHFIEKEDLERSHMVRSISCVAYHNKRNDITFNHDFLSGLSLDESYPEVKKKYDRRIARLMRQIWRSERILLVYIETPSMGHVQISNEEIRAGYEQIVRSFPGKQIDLIYIENRGETHAVEITDIRGGTQGYPETTKRKARGYAIGRPIPIDWQSSCLKYS